MKKRVQFWWDRLRTSFWFLPAIMASSAVALFFVTVEVDRRLESEDWQGAWWVYGGSHAGARAVLSVVASSMITVAGVVFSIMMVVLSLAAQQYGPRLLRNFMRDRITQVVLGVFVATFLYCLLVLRTIRGGNGEFVPQISVTAGVALSILSLSVLIYFIHHVSVSIHIGEIISQVQAELLSAVDGVFPETLGEEVHDAGERNPPPEVLRQLKRQSMSVAANSSGYLQAIDDNKLLTTAGERDIVVQLLVRPGNYILKNKPVMRAAPTERVDDGTMESLRDSLFINSQRTPVQDVLFALERQADIAIRALSPGVNDPLTAIDCLEHLGEALYRLAERRIPSAYRYDENGQLRVIAPQVSFKEMLECSLGLVRQYGIDHAPITIKIIEVIEGLLYHVQRAEDRAALLEQLGAVAATPYDSLSPFDRDLIQARHEQVREKSSSR
jgi:uncharacterized membrane protein